MIRSDDYHDYFLKDGVFVGAFEEMYRNCSDPWHQDTARLLEEDIALFLLKRYSYRRILDLGCGKGRFTNLLQRATEARVTAVDIAPTAVRAAKLRYPNVDFVPASAAGLPFADASFDLAVSCHMLWCVMPQLTEVLEEVRRVLSPGGHYLVLSKYYAPGEQKFAAEVMTCPEDLLRILPFHPLYSIDVNRLSDHRFVVLAERVP